MKNTNRRNRESTHSRSPPTDLRAVLNIIRNQRNGPQRRRVIEDMLSIITTELRQDREEELARQRELARRRELLRERILHRQVRYDKIERAIQIAFPDFTPGQANYLLIHLGYRQNPHYVGEDLRPDVDVGNGQLAERHIVNSIGCSCGQHMEQVMGDLPMLDVRCPRGCCGIEVKAVSAREGRTIIHINPLAAGIIEKYGVHLFSRMSYLTVVVFNGFGQERSVIDTITLHPEFLERHIEARRAEGYSLLEASSIDILDYLQQVPLWKTW